MDKPMNSEVIIKYNDGEIELIMSFGKETIQFSLIEEDVFELKKKIGEVLDEKQLSLSPPLFPIQLAGYRTSPIYLRNSIHVPLPAEALEKQIVHST